MQKIWQIAGKIWKIEKMNFSTLFFTISNLSEKLKNARN